MQGSLNKYITIALCLLVFFNVEAQKEGEFKTYKHSIELFYHNDYFFDETSSNWLAFEPLSFGLQYTYNFNSDHSIRGSVLYFFKNYDYPPSSQPTLGRILERHYGTFSVGYLYNMIKSSYFKLSALGELNYRHGYESVWLDRVPVPGTNLIAETIVGGFKLRDIGLSVGANFGFYIKGFTVSLEPIYTRYLIRGGKSINYNGAKIKATPNTATIKLSLGYRF